MCARLSAWISLDAGYRHHIHDKRLRNSRTDNAASGALDDIVLDVFVNSRADSPVFADPPNYIFAIPTPPFQ